MPDWATIENGHFGIGSCVVLMNHRYSHEKQTRRQVSEDHRIHKSDAASQPSSAEMRTGVKDMHHKEHQAEITFGDTKATKEPVGNQGIGQKASPESVERKQGRDPRNDFLRSRFDSGSNGSEHCWTCDLDGLRKKKIQRSNQQAESSISEEHSTI